MQMLMSNWVSNTQYRVVRIIKTYRKGGKETLKLHLSIASKKNRKKTMAEILSENKGLIRISGEASPAVLRTLSWSQTVNAENGNKQILGFNIDPNKVRSNSDIVSSRLSVKRIPLTYDVDANTDNHPHDQNYFTQSNHPHDQNYFTQSNHTHNVNTLTSEVAYSTQSVNTSGHSSTNNATKNSNAWEDLDASISGPIANMESLWITVNINNTSGTDSNFYARFEQANEGTRYYPDSTGTHVRVLAGKSGTMVFAVPTQWFTKSSANNVLQVDNDAAGPITYMVSWDYFWVPSHKHQINAFTTVGNTAAFTAENATDGTTATFTNANATDQSQAGIPRGKYAPGGESAHNFNYDLDGVNQGTFNNLDVNGTDSASITISTTGDHYIEIYPTGANEIATLVVTLEVDILTDEL